MTREQLEHILRAASKIARDPDVLVIGSQSVLGSFAEDDLPFEATSSIEADVAFFDDPADAKADQVDGAIGELEAQQECTQSRLICALVPVGRLAVEGASDGRSAASARTPLRNTVGQARRRR